MTKLVGILMVLVGILMVLGGICLGLYLGIWVCFIGGIMDIISQIQADTIQPVTVAVGVVKMLGAGVVGVFSGLALILPGIGTFLVGRK